MSDRVLVTGISGFIAKHVALRLLQEGYTVRGTLRSMSRAEEVRDTLGRHGAEVDRLEFVEADLTSESGWDEAVKDCKFVEHVASPFPMKQPRDREALVPAAREGALRVLQAAMKGDVARVVLTSSMVAVMYRPGRPAELKVGENDWTDADWEPLTAYIVSKTRAEKAAWRWMEDHGYKERLTVVNPGFVLGPALDDKIGTSVEVIKLLMTGAYPAVPPAYYPTVDVRDLAGVHVKALAADGAGGRRMLVSGGTMSLAQMGHQLRELYPERKRKIPKHTLPPFMVKVFSNFDRALKSVIPDIGVVPQVDSSYVTEMTGQEFRPPEEAVKASAESLFEHGLLK